MRLSVSVPLTFALTEPRFVFLWTGQTLSRVGDAIFRITLVWLAIELTGSAAAVGGVLAGFVLPMLMMLLIGGVLADRWPRRNIMLINDVILALLTTLAAVLTLTGAVRLWHLVAISLCYSTADGFFQPAYRAIVPEIVDRSRLNSANALTQGSSQLAQVLGPMLGALTIKEVGIAGAFGFNALSYLISVATLARIPAVQPQTITSRRNIWKDVWDGLKYLVSIPWLWMSIVFTALANLLISSPWAVIMPLLVKEAIPGGVGGLAAMYTVAAIGSVVGTVVVGSRKKTFRLRGPLMCGCVAICGMGLASFGFVRSLHMAMPGAFVRGSSVSLANVFWLSVLQVSVPSELQGRIFSLEKLGTFALMPPGFVLIGFLADEWGARLVFLACGAALVALAAVAIAIPSIRRLD